MANRPPNPVEDEFIGDDEGEQVADRGAAGLSAGPREGQNGGVLRSQA